jgi:DNA-binding CsgD family transcriptional regulator
MKNLLASNQLVLRSAIVATSAVTFFQFMHVLHRPSDRQRRMFLALLGCFLLYGAVHLLIDHDDGHLIDISGARRRIDHIVHHVATIGLASSIVWYHHSLVNAVSNIAKRARWILYGLALMAMALCAALARTGGTEHNLALTCQVPLAIVALLMGYYLVSAFSHRDAIASKTRNDGSLSAGVSVGLCFVGLVPVASMLHAVVLETMLAFAGLFSICVVHLRGSVSEARREYARLQTAGQSMAQIVRANCVACQLTAREVQVVERLVTGLPYKVIAAELDISEKTVSRHVGNIFVKVGVTNKTELVHRLQQAPGP